jgi:ABC-type bacteriocin/lantibiotic exporter with double-glycine peptidase domain
MPNNSLPVLHRSQRDNADCLAACASMVLTFLGLTVSYERLLTTLGITRFGAPHSRIQRLQDLFPALHIAHQQGDLPDLFRAVDAGNPPIVYVRTGELPYWTEDTFHAIVLIGYDETHCTLLDPAMASQPQRITQGDLILAWLDLDNYYTVITQP